MCAQKRLGNGRHHPDACAATGNPAIGKGNNAANQVFDQRRAGYLRTSRTILKAEIGTFQFDSIFADDFD